MTTAREASANAPDPLCPIKGRQIEQAWADHRAGDERAFLELVGSIYDWLDGRVAALLRRYPGLKVPADEVLHDEVLGRVSRSLARNQAGSCEDFVRLVSSEIRWAVRTVLRERGRQPTSLESAGEAGDADWLDDPRAVNPLEEILAREEGERFTKARARFDAAAGALPEPLRQTFCLRYYAGLPLAEVAAEVGVSDRAVRERLGQALDALSESLTGQPFPGKPPQFKGAGDPDEGRARCRPCQDESD